ncbi:DMT family transporter [Mycobacterium sp.]|uniref:DMT family transporter n=1 Tax=Mycobacterium sp. TaxID=1785 RepID=UPI002D9C49F3|nr:DMT family transporter [Mycobacterium sp.]
MPSAGVGHRQENLVLGGTFTTLSFLCVALVSAFGKAAGQYTSTGVVVLFQNLIALLFIGPIAVRGGFASVRTDKIGLHIVRAAAGTACWYALFLAMTMMPLTNAILLTFSAPLWMPVIAWLLSRQKASMATWAGAGLGFVGVVLVLQPHHQHFTVGALFALAGALLLAVALMSVRWLGATEPMFRILFYYFLLSTVMVVPFAVIQWQPLQARAWIYLIGVGFAQLFSQVFIVLAYRYASSVKLGPFVYTTIAFTALIDWAVWDHPPTLFVFLGMALVIGGGLVAIRGKPTAQVAGIET